MPSVHEARIHPHTLAFRVLQKKPDLATAQDACRGVKRFLHAKRPALAQALEIEVDAGQVVLRASGEVPDEMLREALELLESARPPEAEDEIRVDPSLFAVQTTPEIERLDPEREVLRSRVRYFPCPVCEWFEISTGELTLSDRQIVYEPEWVIMQDEAAQQSGRHVIPLESMLDFGPGEWWDVPCLMIETPEVTYRYGWPAERGELDRIFDVEEWLRSLRDLLQSR
jgi:hypothetical protein